jgi:hypothetical protein
MQCIKSLNMFSLESAIAEWRCQMLAAGINAPVPLDELESHLRDDIEQRVGAGDQEARAFELAVQRIGHAAPLRKEFMKTKNFKTIILQKWKALIRFRREIPLPAFDDFEPAALQALQAAPDVARHFNHDFVGTEHLLLALTRSGSKAVINVIQKLGAPDEILRREIERMIPNGATAVTAPLIPYTPRARQSIKLAGDEARKLNQPHVRAEHIFLGLLGEGSGVAAIVLKNLGVRLETARAEILKEMDAHPEAGGL